MAQGERRKLPSCIKSLEDFTLKGILSCFSLEIVAKSEMRCKSNQYMSVHNIAEVPNYLNK